MVEDLPSNTQDIPQGQFQPAQYLGSDSAKRRYASVISTRLKSQNHNNAAN